MTGAGEAAPLLGEGSARRKRAWWLWWRRDAAAGAQPRSKAPPARESKLLRVCSFILGNEACERLAYYGLSTNLIVYLTTVLGFNSAVAAQQVNLWSGMCYVTSLMGAWIADEYMCVTHSLTHSLARSLARSLAHSLTRLFAATGAATGRSSPSASCTLAGACC